MRRRYPFLLLALLIALLPAVASCAPGFEIHFLDVGQADASIILCDGDAMIIDGGNRDDSDFIFSYLRNTLKIKHLKYMVSTHADEDHVGGLAGALNACSVGTVFSPVTQNDTAVFRDFVKYVERFGEIFHIPRVGEIFALGSAQFQMLGPVSNAYTDPNDGSIVLRIVYKETSFLFMADAGEDAELDIVHMANNGMYKLESTLIRLGHHGSASSTYPVLLRAVKPKYAVMSVGKDNKYKHPSPYILERLEQHGVSTLYRTDIHGTIICVSDGINLTFTTEKKVLTP